MQRSGHKREQDRFLGLQEDCIAKGKEEPNYEGPQMPFQKVWILDRQFKDNVERFKIDII